MLEVGLEANVRKPITWRLLSLGVQQNWSQDEVIHGGEPRDSSWPQLSSVPRIRKGQKLLDRAPVKGSEGNLRALIS